MQELIFAWFNIPFWTMLLFVILLLGTTVALGGADADIESDISAEIDTDADLAIETDVDIDADIDADVDVDIDSDGDISATHITGDQLTAIKAEKKSLITTHKRKKTNLMLLIFAGTISYLNAGKVPLSIILSALLTIWASLGLIINSIIIIATGGMATFNIPVVGSIIFGTVMIGSLCVSFPITRRCSSVIGAVFDTKTYHSRNEDYIGSTAKVVSHVMPTFDEATSGKSIGILSLTDDFGVQQKVYAFISDDCKIIPKYKDTVVIIDYLKEKRLYKVVVEDSDDFFKWQNL